MWLSDITEHPTAEGKLYLCAIKDACSTRIVGYSMDGRMTSELAVNAVDMAVARRGGAPTVLGCVVHTDRGSQGGFNWSSQHLDVEVFDGEKAAGGRSRAAPEDAIARQVGIPAAGRA